MARRDAGDAVAFSVALAQTRHVQRRGHPTMTPPPLCVVRVERRRSERHSWERVMEDTTALQSLNVVSRLERHRFEHRLSLCSCADPTLLAMPSALWVPRIQSGTEYQHPHVGTFQLIKTAQRSPQTDGSVCNSSRGIVFATVIVAVLVGVFFFVVHSCKNKRTELSWPWKEWVRRYLALLQRWKQYLPRTSTANTQAEAKEKTSVLKPSPRLECCVFEDLDEEDQQPDMTTELLTTELPDFNDESGWRDFFESQIYRREERQTRPEDAESSAPLRQRTLITRSGNSSDTRRTDRSARNVPPSEKKASYSVSTRIDDGATFAARAPASAVSTSPNVTLLRHQRGRDHRSETASSISATRGPSNSTKPQSNRMADPSPPADDFGEFWQM